MKYELLKAAEELFEKKTEIIELFNFIDQFRLMKKIFLNKNQCFMLENRDTQSINNNNTKRLNKMMYELNEDKINKNKSNLKEYLAKKKKEDSLTEVDNLLLEYMDDSLKEDVM